MADDPKIVWHKQSVTPEQRFALSGHRGCVVWLTGLSGSGKSTIANILDQKLISRNIRSYLIDGDNIRHGLCAGANILDPIYGRDFACRFGLGFESIDREENIRRVGAVSQLFAAAGIVCLTALVSPYRADRNRVRKWVESNGEPGDFVEVYVNTPLETCIQRDPKGLYRLAIEGKLPNFTGISDPYEQPDAPELELLYDGQSPEVLADRVVDFLVAREIIPSSVL